MKHYYKIIGLEPDAKPLPRKVLLGYSSNPSQAFREYIKNGWKKENLKFAEV